MNTEHKSINDIVPHGEFIRGFANQSFLTNAELHRIMKSRGIFFFISRQKHNGTHFANIVIKSKRV